MTLIGVLLIVLFMCTLPSMASDTDCEKGGCFFTSPSIKFPPLSPPPNTASSQFNLAACHTNCNQKANCIGFLFESKTFRCQLIQCGEEGTVTSSSNNSANLMWTADVKDGGDRPWLRYFGSSEWDEKTLTDPSFVQSTIETAKEHCKELPAKTPEKN